MSMVRGNILPNGQKIAPKHRDFAISASGVCAACVKIDRYQIGGLYPRPGKGLIIIMFHWHPVFAHSLIIRD
ncbi:MAG: hypothetical protein QE284_06755 [Rhizobium sp.]|nr:hypothetical protein [Rhizobium sp.]